MIIKYLFRTYIIILGLVTGISGCTALNSFPQAARGGDTIALAVGSADGMTRANTTASFESDANPGVFHDITSGIRGIFNLYADKASSTYSVGSNTGSIISTSGHEAWVTVMVVDLPLLPIGPGKVHITTTAPYPTIGSHINNIPIDLEILAGTGAASDFAYEFGVGSSLGGDLTLLEPMTHAQIIPDYPQSTSWPKYGAIEMKLHVPTTQGVKLPPAALRVVADDINPTSQSILIYNHDDNEDLTVMFLSPTGGLNYFEPRFSIVPLVNSSLNIGFTQPPVITSVSYFDINGNPVSGPLVSEFSVEVR